MKKDKIKLVPRKGSPLVDCRCVGDESEKKEKAISKKQQMLHKIEYLEGLHRRDVIALQSQHETIRALKEIVISAIRG